MYLEKVNPYSISKQHKRDKLHILERVRLLFDKDSFVESYPESEGLSGYDGVITGYGRICGQKVFFYGQDFTCMGGTFGYQHSMQIVSIIKEAIREKKPVIGIYDGGGARIQEGAAAVAGCGELFHYNTIASGYIPQIAIVAGTCAGGAVYSPGLADFVFTIEDVSNMFVTGAKVINEIQGTDYLIEELGGADIHTKVSGVAHFKMKDERSCYGMVRRLVDMLPPCYDTSRIFRTGQYYEKDLSDIETLLPKNCWDTYDVRSVLDEILDDDSFLEIQKDFARNVVIGLAQLGGLTVGIVANQTIYADGGIDVDCADKAARFVSFCDCFNIPVLTFVDSSGFVMEAEQEHRGLIRHGAKLIHTYASATTIRLTVVLRKAYGGPYILMGCKQLGSDKTYVWPKAEVAVMKAEAAVAVISHGQLSRLEGKEKEEYRKEQLAEYTRKYMNSNLVLKRNFVDEEILPKNTRRQLYQDLIHFSQCKEESFVCKKHGNMPV